MKKYRVLVEGVNFLINIDDEIKKYGFYTSRLVHATDETEAELRVMDMLRIELKNTVLNEASDSPMMFAEEVEEVDMLYDDPASRTGFVWYPDEREGH
jgi:hypothetical protein